MIGAFSKRGAEPFYWWRNNYGETLWVKMARPRRSCLVSGSVVCGHPCASGKRSWSSGRTFALSGTSCAVGRRRQPPVSPKSSIAFEAFRSRHLGSRQGWFAELLPWSNLIHTNRSFCHQNFCHDVTWSTQREAEKQRLPKDVRL